MNKIIFSLYLLILVFSGVANTKTDSLKHIIDHASIEKQVEVNLELGKLFFDTNNDSSLFYLQKNTKFDNTSPILVAESYQLIALIQEENQNQDKAVDAYLASLHLFLKGDSLNQASNIYNALGIIYIGKTKHSKAINFFQKGIQLAAPNANNKTLSSLYSNLAIAYKLSGQISLSEEYCEKAQYLKQKNFDLSENKTNQQINNDSKVNVGILIALLLLILTSGIILFLHLTLKKRNNKLHKLQVDNEFQRKQIEDKDSEIQDIEAYSEKISGYKSEFLANISHEIRTPLNAITGYINLLQKQIDPEKSNTYIHNALIASGNLGIIINDLLDISRIEAGKMVIEKTLFNPIQIVAQAISTLKLKAEEKNIAIELHFDPFIPDQLLGDPYRLSQVLINLINNAIKFSNSGTEVSISVKCTSQADQCELGFSISDRGYGIAEDQLDHIFESFTQISSNTARNQTGTGMGLAIVKRLVELQDGEISVESKLSEGSKFSFAINYQVVPIEKVIPQKTESKISNNQKIENCAVLLVEDNEINQQLAKDTILSWDGDYTVDIAENGRIAIDMLEQATYHVVLMDIQMPELNGHEATLEIRTNKEKAYNNIPIIGMTAHALPQEKELAFKNGMNEYIIKPFNPEELQQKINSFVLKNIKPK